MQDVGFSAIFVGIESPDEETLKAVARGVLHDLKQMSG